MQKRYFASMIGSLAVDQLVEGCAYTIRGNTSRGIFLESGSGGIIFLSYEEYAGPLTVNIPAVIKELISDLEPGMTTVIQDKSNLILESKELRIAIDTAAEWKPQPIPEGISFEALEKTILELIELSKGSQYSGSLFDSTAKAISSDLPVSSQEPDLRVGPLNQAVQLGDRDAILRSAGRLAGFGKGLTPAGDDLLSGLILTASRYKQVVPELKEYIEIFKDIPILIAQKSTRLSYAIALAALEGLADERILAGLDNLAAGSSGEQVLECMSGYGASSGMDTLAGAMMLLNKCIKKRILTDP
jgi:hypothetical protein